MQDWIRFDESVPSQGEFIVAITHRGQDLPMDVWERDLERNAVGVWVDGEIWEGDVSRTGLTHWMPLPARPQEMTVDRQLFLWEERTGHSG